MSTLSGIIPGDFDYTAPQYYPCALITSEQQTESWLTHFVSSRSHHATWWVPELREINEDLTLGDVPPAPDYLLGKSIHIQAVLSSSLYTAVSPSSRWDPFFPPDNEGNCEAHLQSSLLLSRPEPINHKFIMQIKLSTAPYCPHCS